MNRKGGFYHVIVAVSVILIAGLVWTVLNNTLVTVQSTFENVTPLNITSSVHSTQKMIEQYQLGESIFYMSMFGLSLILLFWSVKRTQEERGLFR